MVRIWASLVLYIILGTAISADQVERKADDMVNAIAQQNKKVEQQSDAMEKAIEDKAKQLNTKEQEENFEKASKEVNAVEDAAETKFEQKANLVDKIGDDANNSIEKQTKKVEALASKADVAEDNASKLVDKIGEQIEKGTKSKQAKPRMSISYSVKVPSEPRTDQMVERASYYDDYFKGNAQVKKAYPWSSEHRPLESHDDQEDSANDLSLKPFDDSNVEVEHDALANDEYEDPPNMHSTVRNIKTIYRPQLSYQFPRHRRRRKHRHHRFRPYYSAPDKAQLVQPTPKSDVGLFVLPSGGPRELADDIRNQFEDDQLLKKAAKQPLSSQEDRGLVDELKAGAAAERDMERQWVKINAIGSPEMLMHWPQRELGSVGNQQVSVINPGMVDLLQTEYPKNGVMESNLPGINRSKVKEKEAVS